MECLCHITGTKTFHDGICKNFAIICARKGESVKYAFSVDLFPEGDYIHSSVMPCRAWYAVIFLNVA